MQILDNKLYSDDVEYVAKLDLPWGKFQDNFVWISGATGMIGSCLIDVIMRRNIEFNMNCKVYAIGRNEARAKDRFQTYWDRKDFYYISHDINEPLNIGKDVNVGYVFHLASNTHPVAYATDPIGTVTTNVIGLKNLLDFAVKNHATRFAFASSNEVYGENRGDVEFFDEEYCGYIDSNTLRAGYPESKRCGEALCQAYRKQEGMNVVIPRLTRSYGPTMLMSDTKAISQFILKGVAGEDIVLKSAGTQYYSYTYVTDAVAGLLTVILKGEDGEAYNISDKSGDIMLKDMATVIAEYVGTKVVFELPDDLEKSGYSTATKARLDGHKLQGLGWKSYYTVESGIKRTIEILRKL